MKGIQLQFVNWLHYEKDAYDEWATLLFKRRNLKTSEFLGSEEPCLWIHGAFPYPLSQEYYWRKLSEEWQEELLDILRNKNEQT